MIKLGMKRSLPRELQGILKPEKDFEIERVKKKDFVGEKSWCEGKTNCMVNERGVEKGYLWTFVLTLERKDLSLCLGGFVLRRSRQNQKKNKYSLFFLTEINTLSIL